MLAHPSLLPAGRPAPQPPHQPHLPRSSHSSSSACMLCPAPAALGSSLDRPARGSTRSRRAARVPALTAGDDGPAVLEDSTIKVKLMLAASSGRLDLSECGLTAVPPAVFELTDLEELSLAGNPSLSELPAEVGRLTSLQRLQLAGCSLEALPAELGGLAALEGLWLHGNRLAALPEALSTLAGLTQLSLAGNCLRELPRGLGALTALRELSAAGNHLQELPPTIGDLASLTKLSLHGNELAELPPAVSGLCALEELWLQGNPRLRALPAGLGQLPCLKHLSAADCALESVPAELGSLPALQSLSLYGNRLQAVPPAILQAPRLKYLWLEANPLSPPAAQALMEAAPAAPGLASLGLDSSQLQGVPPAAHAAAGGRVRLCAIHGAAGPGYFKLEPARELALDGAAAGNHNQQQQEQQPAAGRARALVVSFGSAPGTPNWGGVLGKVRAAAADDAEADFDVLYVVDPHRAWYRGGEEGGYQQFEGRLASLTSQYKHVVFIGDSMGATAALLFSHLATSVHAFCPQVDLASASIRPGQPREWFDALRARVLANVGRSGASIRVHVGNWSHDLDQARLLPPERVHVQIYSADTHRLALLLDKRGRLQQVIRGAVLQELGLPSGHVRLANLV